MGASTVNSSSPNSTSTPYTDPSAISIEGTTAMTDMPMTSVTVIPAVSSGIFLTRPGRPRARGNRKHARATAIPMMVT